MKIKTNSRHYKIKRLGEILSQIDSSLVGSATEYWRTLLDTELTEELKKSEEELAKRLTEAS